MASGTPDQTRTVIEAGAVPIFVQLLRNPDANVREQAVWALGNIAGDSHECRDFVLRHNTMEALLDQLVPTSGVSMLRNATWTLSNLCRGKVIKNPLLRALQPTLPLTMRSAAGPTPPPTAALAAPA